MRSLCYSGCIILDLSDLVCLCLLLLSGSLFVKLFVSLLAIYGFSWCVALLLLFVDCLLVLWEFLVLCVCVFAFVWFLGC